MQQFEQITPGKPTIELLMHKNIDLEHKIKELELKLSINIEKTTNLETQNNLFFTQSNCNIYSSHKITRKSNNFYLKRSCSENKAISRRTNNLILFGVKESQSENRTQKEIHDRVLVQKVFKSIGIINKTEIVKTERLQCKSGIAPLLIELNSSDNRTNQHMVLKAARNLKYTNDYSSVSISQDLLVSERMIAKELIRLRIDLNRKLKENFPEAGYYYGIRAGKIIKLNKHQIRNVNQIKQPIINQEMKAFYREQSGMLNP